MNPQIPLLVHWPLILGSTISNTLRSHLSLLIHLCVSQSISLGGISQVYVAASTSANLGHGYSLVLLMLPLWEMLPPSEQLLGPGSSWVYGLRWVGFYSSRHDLQQVCPPLKNCQPQLFARFFQLQRNSCPYTQMVIAAIVVFTYYVNHTHKSIPTLPTISIYGTYIKKITEGSKLGMDNLVSNKLNLTISINLTISVREGNTI